MINNIRFKINAGKINKIPEFYTNFARKMPDYIIRQRDRGQAEAKTSRPRPRPRPKFWPRGHFGLEDLTSLQIRSLSNSAIRVKHCRKTPTHALDQSVTLHCQSW